MRRVLLAMILGTVGAGAVNAPVMAQSVFDSTPAEWLWQFQGLIILLLCNS